MTRPIEKLARLLLARVPTDATVGEVAAEYEETPERILDALDVCKILGATGEDRRDGAPISYLPL